MENGTREVLNQQYPSTLESVDVVENEVLKAASELGFDEDAQNHIGMAVRECAVNAVVHGNRYSRNKQVHVILTCSPDSLEIRIGDQGEGFEKQAVPDPLHDNNLLRHSGRGLFLMDAFMDEVRYRRLEPNGTEVTLVKKVPR